MQFPAQAASEIHRRENTLAVARMLLSVTALAAIYLDPTEPTRFARLAYALLVAYVAYSAAILLFLRSRKVIGSQVPVLIHVTSLIWAAAISLFTSGPSSAFFVFFVFVILAAAYRWRMRESLMTTGVLVLILFGQAALYKLPSAARLLGNDLDLNRLIMRGAYLLIMGFFAGLLGDREKQFSSEIAAIHRLSAEVHLGTPIEKSFESLVEKSHQLFRARLVLLILHSVPEDRYQLLQTNGGAAEWREVSQAEGQALFFPLGANAVRVRRKRGTLVATATSAAPARRIAIPEVLGSFQRGLLAGDAAAGDDWRVRLFVIDSAHAPEDGEPLQFFERMLAQLLPTIHNTFLVNRIREQVGAVERARIARELHDGTIQSLSSVCLQLSVLRQNIGEPKPETGRDVDRIREIVAGEVANIRDLIQHIRSSNVKPDELVPAIIDLAERFERETGISVRLNGLPDRIDLPGKACSELLYILQEALINVRKHSKGQTVLVSFLAENGTFRLSIDDDGDGFPFEGQLSWSQLQATRKGPIVIKERVRLLGGKLDIHSKPGCGSKLEITIPTDTKRRHAEWSQT